MAAAGDQTGAPNAKGGTAEFISNDRANAIAHFSSADVSNGLSTMER
jgi:hypothetical protein